jgi:hypothetical protein
LISPTLLCNGDQGSFSGNKAARALERSTTIIIITTTTIIITTTTTTIIIIITG